MPRLCATCLVRRSLACRLMFERAASLRHTLRHEPAQVYKELLVEHDKIIPSWYQSKVRVQTLLPVSMAAQTKQPPRPQPLSTWVRLQSFGALYRSARGRACAGCSA